MFFYTVDQDTNEKIKVSPEIVTSVFSQDSDIKITFLGNNKTYTRKIHAPTLKHMFPKVIIMQYDIFIADETKEHKFRIDLESELAKLLFSESDIDDYRHQQLRMFDYNVPIYIPDELVDKYCIIFANTILACYDSEADAIREQTTTYKYVNTMLYAPTKRDFYPKS